MIQKKSESLFTGYIYIINTVLFFSTYEVVNKTLVGLIDPIKVNLIRFFFGSLMLFAILGWKKQLRISKRQLFLCFLAGFLNIAISMSFIQYSLFVKGSSASLVAILFSSNPLFLSIISAIRGKTKMSFRRLGGFLTGMTGIVVVLFNKLDLTGLNMLSPILALLAAVSYAVYTLVAGNVVKETGSLKMNAYSFLLGSIMLLPFLLIMKIPVVVIEHGTLLQLIYLSFLNTGFAYLTYFKGLEIIGAVKGSLVFLLKPAFASILAVVFLGEAFTIMSAAGILLIVTGVYISQTK